MTTLRHTPFSAFAERMRPTAWRRSRTGRLTQPLLGAIEVSIEREIAAPHRQHRIMCERIPLSGAAGGSFSSDLSIGGLLRGEVKARGIGQGFVSFERWLGENDVLFLRCDRALPLVVVPFKTWAALLAERQR